MLMVSSYAKYYVEACRANVAGQLASYRTLLAAKPSGIDAFERQFFNHMILALDRYFVHRGRTMEGKDGNPLNEVRMLCDAIIENRGRMCANKTISLQAGKLDPAIPGRRRDTAEPARFRPAVRGVLRRDREEVPVTASEDDPCPIPPPPRGPSSSNGRCRIRRRRSGVP